jgi:predicted lactoylglutathione lyase
MIDHTGVAVSDFARSKAFYLAALAPIGYELLAEFAAAVTGSADVAGFGVAPKPDFWIAGSAPQRPPIHVAFRVETRSRVDAFHAAALRAGGKSNGEPGLRPHYHANYYGAFVLDFDGHNIEAVCHEPA